MFRQNSSSCFGRDAIKVKIKDGCRRPNLSTGPNHFRMDTSRLLGKHQKKSDQWSRSSCDNEKNVYERTDGWMDGGLYTKYRNLAAESDPGCYGIAG